MSTEDDDIEIEGMFRQIIAEQQDNEVDAVLVLVFQEGKATVYNANMKPEIVELVAELLADKTDG